MDNLTDTLPPKVQFISSGSRGSLTLYSGSSTSQVFQFRSEEQERCAKQIISFVMKDDFVEGEISKTQLYLEKLHLRDPFLFRDSFTRAWVKLFGLDNEVHIYTLASVASCLPYEWLEHHGITLILGCSSHPSLLVNEACLRLAEAWEQHDHVEYLKKMRTFDYPWLEEYRVNVIEFLERLS
ncbi:hypothetical protein FWP28_18800 [Vibrio alginolyticus]|uniref:hypothetical protein n=1 Tax=Vibrio sp. Y176 TaxID=3074704 RepID=UPI001D47576B|nr:hypothetical protein [Vibrio sp. Y176]EGQ9716317.1 hypothetical protein [Vibrio alginolyticus]MDW1629049.1 hypothetical protein [Vibrio sp. Y176]